MKTKVSKVFLPSALLSTTAGLPEHTVLPLAPPPLSVSSQQLPQAAAPSLRLRSCSRFFWRWSYVTPDPGVLAPPAALDAEAQRRTLAQELLLASAPHLVQVDGSFALTEAFGR